MYVYNNDAQISKYFIEMNYTMYLVMIWVIGNYRYTIYNFLADLHKPEVIFIDLNNQSVYKADKIYVVENWVKSIQIHQNTPEWWSIYNKIKYRLGLGNTLSPCKILNIYDYE